MSATSDALYIQYVCDYVVVAYGASQFAAAKDDKSLTIYGPPRSSKKLAFEAGLKKYRGEHAQTTI